MLLRKLFRDIRAMKVQTTLLVLLLMISAGTAIALAQTSENLHQSVDRTYSELRLCDLSVHTVPVPSNASLTMASLDGVRSVETRLLQDCRITGYEARGLLIGMEHRGHPDINDVKVIRGRYFDDADGQVLVEKHFADAHDLGPGDELDVMTMETRFTLEVVGVAISPEYLFVMGDPAHVFPDESSFGALFVPLPFLQNVTNMTGLVNNILVLADDPEAVYASLKDDGEPVEVAENVVRIDRRNDIWSVWALNNDLHGFDELSGLVTILVLLIGGSALGIAMARLVTAQRREIGILLALGSSRKSIVAYYLLFGLVIGAVGALAGCILAVGLSWMIVGYYSSSLNIPLVVFELVPGVFMTYFAYVVGIAIAFGSVPAVRASMMRPYEAIKLFSGETPGIGGRMGRRAPLPLKLAVRNISRRRLRSTVTALGIGLSLVIPISIAAIFTSIDHTIDVAFDGERWDDIVTFTHPVNTSVALALNDLAGVERAEPVLFTYGLVRERYYTFRGIDMTDTLTRLNIVEGTRFTGPDTMIIDEKVAREQGISVGDVVTVRFPGNASADLTVVGLNSVILQGICYLPLGTLQDLSYPGMVTGALIVGDASEALDLPYVQAIVPKEEGRDNMHQMIIDFSPFLYVFLILGALIALTVSLTGVIINMEEREVEFGTMMTIGASNGFIVRSCLIENGILSLFGGAAALVLGHWAAAYTLKAFSTGVFTLIMHIPFHFDLGFYLLAVGLTLLAVLILSPKVRRLDLPELAREVSR